MAHIGSNREISEADISDGALFTVDDLCESFQVCRSTVYRLIKNSGLPCVRIGRVRRFSRRAIAQWISDQAAKPPVSQAYKKRNPS